MSRKKRLIDKKVKKLSDGKCFFCDCNNYDLLDNHRIIEGGEYSDFNTLTVCALCHRKIHARIIIIDRKYQSTKGKFVLHYWIDGKEFWEEK